MRAITTAIPEIDANPACQAMLDTLTRMRSLSTDLVSQDAREHPTLEAGWLGELLTTVSRELRAGRDIPFAAADENTSLMITEGAVRELVRAAGDSVDGVLVGSCRLDGDLADPTATVRVSLVISVALSAPIATLAEQVRKRVHTQLLKHTQLTIEAIDVTVTDVHELTSPTEESQE